MRNMNAPVNREVNVPLRTIIEAVLRYEDLEMGYNPFHVTPTVIEGGVIVTDRIPDDPESLNHDAYKIGYVWKRASQQGLSEYEKTYDNPTHIADLFEYGGIPTTINWDHIKWDMFPQAREGYHKLETLISSLESK